MSDELKPCPLCKRQPVTHHRQMWTGLRYQVLKYVFECHVVDHHLSAEGVTEAGSIGSWNARPAEDALARRVAELEAAIRDHRAQKADDRCIADDDRLYAALGDGIRCDRRVGDKTAMLINCARFIEKRCEGGGWPSYAELEAENKRLKEALKEKR
jgi:hypothetical protein